MRALVGVGFAFGVLGAEAAGLAPTLRSLYPLLSRSNKTYTKKQAVAHSIHKKTTQYLAPATNSPIKAHFFSHLHSSLYPYFPLPIFPLSYSYSYSAHLLHRKLLLRKGL